MKECDKMFYLNAIKDEINISLSASNNYKKAYLWETVLNKNKTYLKDINNIDSKIEKLEYVLNVQQSNPNWVSASIEALGQVREVINNSIRIISSDCYDETKRLKMREVSEKALNKLLYDHDIKKLMLSLDPYKRNKLEYKILCCIEEAQIY